MQGPSQQLCVLVPTEHRDSGRQGGTHLGLPPEAWLGGGGRLVSLLTAAGRERGPCERKGPSERQRRGARAGRLCGRKILTHYLFACIFQNKLFERFHLKLHFKSS